MVSTGFPKFLSKIPSPAALYMYGWAALRRHIRSLELQLKVDVHHVVVHVLAGPRSGNSGSGPGGCSFTETNNGEEFISVCLKFVALKK